MKIVLDAGHGYNTPGKRSPDGLQEYEINRSIASYARKYLLAYRNVTITFTHSDQQDVPLKTRTAKANSMNADCLISIHANAAGNGIKWNSAAGIETFVHHAAGARSRSLADKVQQNMVVATGLRNRGVKTVDLYILRETKMAAVLVECGFMTNQSEAKLLQSDTYRKACGEAIAEAIAQEYGLQKVQTAPLPPSTGLYKVQVGAFHNKQNAEALAMKLKRQGYEPYILFEKQ
ncbi:MAG: N-acetylmuramoyl-L-alanine amidase [Bacillus sp. (in: firmicutes)]